MGQVLAIVFQEEIMTKGKVKVILWNFLHYKIQNDAIAYESSRKPSNEPSGSIGPPTS
jgi:hypothetical protein